jgi:protein-tyrosine phosphatase
MRRPIYAVLLLLSGCVYFSKHTVEGACTDDLNSPIRNFCVAETAKIWQGERPSSSDASWLLEHHVGTVVNLEVYLDDRHAFEQASAPQGELMVEYYHVRDYEPVHLVNWSLLDDHVAHFLAIVAIAPKPVYVHCLDGIDRSNVLIASYRVLVEGVNPEDAIREIERFHSPWLPVDAKYIRSLVERHAAILEKASKWQTQLTPAARIECSHGRCTYSTAGPAAGSRPGKMNS